MLGVTKLDHAGEEANPNLTLWDGRCSPVCPLDRHPPRSGEHPFFSEVTGNGLESIALTQKHILAHLPLRVMFYNNAVYKAAGSTVIFYFLVCSDALCESVGAKGCEEVSSHDP